MTFRHSKWQYFIALCCFAIFLFILHALTSDISFSNYIVYGEKVVEHQKQRLGLSKKGSDSIMQQAALVDGIFAHHRSPMALTDADGKPIHNRIVSVPNFGTSFPDINDVQLATAKKMGLAHRVKDRAEAESRKDGLVFIGDNPFYRVEKLNQSIPYLTPRAARLLEEIGRAFMDSCMAKGVGMHKIVVTSVLRTQADVDRLRRYNANASENSCHLYGTTFDIGYNKYDRINDPTQKEKPTEWGVKLKSILAEVLSDQRTQGTCYIKYEYKKPCFHITAR
ncbi:MAG: hypothetical protein IJ816_00445 [Alloprevotella sp.]|nr:hypothetical protein [Alloprevotella sp.]